jgi:tetratricopeptide (TPR) repeat protein
MDHEFEAVLDEIDDIEMGLEGHQPKIEALERLAAEATAGSRRWAELLLIASNHRVMVGEYAAAITQLEQVRAAGVESEPSVEAHLLSAHLAAGDDAEAAILDRELRARSRETHLGDDYLFIGESYEEAGRLKDALRWFSMANRDIDPGDVDQLDYLAVSGRLRVRQSLGLPQDAYDVSARTLRTEHAAR